MTSDNIDWRHFLNYTWLSGCSDRPSEHIPADEELFGTTSRGLPGTAVQAYGND